MDLVAGTIQKPKRGTFLRPHLCREEITSGMSLAIDFIFSGMVMAIG